MRTVLVALLLPLAACASSSETRFSELEPIISLETIDLAYKGDISRKGLPVLPQGTYDNEATDKGQVDVRVQIFEIESKALQQLMAPKGIWMRAERVLHGAAQGTLAELCRSKDAKLVQSPRLSLTRGNRSNLAAYNSFSYVDSFDLKPLGSETIADPIVKHGRDGLCLEITPALDDEQGMCSVAVQLTVSSLQRPIPATTGKVPGTDTKIEIQTPMFATQGLNFEVTLGTGEGLLIGPLAPMEGTRPLMILLSATSIAQVEAAASQSPASGDRELPATIDLDG